MRIGLLIYGSLEVLSGGYLYNRILVEHLRQAGHSVEIIALPWRNYWQHLRDNCNAQLLARLQTLAVDVLIQDELNHPSLAWLNQRLRGNVRYPIVSLIHLIHFHEPLPRWQAALVKPIERRYLNSVDAFIYNSQHSRQLVESVLKTTRPAVVALPAGNRLGQISAAEVTTRAHTAGTLNILCLGNVIARKGALALLQAVAQAGGTAYAVRLVGRLDMETRYVGECRAFTARHGLNVQFCGALYGEDLQAQLRWAHILGLPSRYEGYGIAYVEGLAYGLAALASNTGAAGEIITHGKDGWLNDPQDISAMASQLREWQENRTRLAQMGLAALERASQLPTWQDTCTKIANFLQELQPAPR